MRANCLQVDYFERNLHVYQLYSLISYHFSFLTLLIIDSIPFSAPSPLDLAECGHIQGIWQCCTEVRIVLCCLLSRYEILMNRFNSGVILFT